MCTSSAWHLVPPISRTPQSHDPHPKSTWTAPREKGGQGTLPVRHCCRGEQETWTRRGNARHMAHAMGGGPRMAGFVDAAPRLTRKSPGDVMPHSVRHKRNLRSPAPRRRREDPSSMCTSSVSASTTPPAILLNTPTPVRSARVGGWRIPSKSTINAQLRTPMMRCELRAHITWPERAPNTERQHPATPADRVVDPARRRGR